MPEPDPSKMNPIVLVSSAMIHIPISTNSIASINSNLLITFAFEIF